MVAWQGSGGRLQNASGSACLKFDQPNGCPLAGASLGWLDWHGSPGTASSRMGEEEYLTGQGLMDKGTPGSHQDRGKGQRDSWREGEGNVSGRAGMVSRGERNVVRVGLR